MDEELLRALRQAISEMTAAGNASAQAANQLSDSLDDANRQIDQTGTAAGKVSNSLKNLTGPVKLAYNAVSVFTQVLNGYIQVQLRLTKSVMAFQTSIYESENALNNLSQGLDAQYKYFEDLAKNTAGPIAKLVQDIPIIGDIVKAGAENLKLGLEIVAEANKQSMTVITRSFTAMQALSGQFGVLTTDVQDFSRMAVTAGLTSEQFGRILGSNADVLTRAFDGNRRAARTLGQEFSYLKDETDGTRAQFVALGMGTDEIASAMSSFAYQQRLVTGEQEYLYGELAKRTLEYTKNLRAVSAITGQNVEEQQAERRRLLDNARFVAKLEELRASGREAEADALLSTVEIFKQFGPAMERVVIEQAIYGGQARSIEANRTILMNRALASASSDAVKATQGFTESQEEARRQAFQILDDRADEIKASRDATRGLVQLGYVTDNTYIQDIGEAFINTRDMVNRTGTLVDTFNASLRKADETVTGITQIITDAERRQQQTRVTTETNILLDNQGKVAAGSLQVATAFEELVVRLNQSRRDIITGVQNFTNDLVNSAGELTPEALLRIGEIGRQSGMTDTERQIESIDKEIADIRAKTNVLQGGKFQLFHSPEDQARLIELQKERQRLQSLDLGGVATGPSTGYRAILHGTEAVVPLPDGRNIPVELDTSKLDEALGKLMDAKTNNSQQSLEKLESLMEQSVGLNDRILQALKQSNRTGDKMMRVIS